MIRFATPDDATRICAIYNHFVQHTAITFEEHRGARTGTGLWSDVRLQE